MGPSQVCRLLRTPISTFDVPQFVLTRLLRLPTSAMGNSYKDERRAVYNQADEKSLKGNRKQRSRLICGALPTAVAATGSALAVAGAIFALTRLNKDTIPVLKAKQDCDVCGGSGVCPTCKGEGFVNKNLSPEAAAKARAAAKDAATRYTAGLAKKWNYCKTCAGQRGCQSCGGRGWVQ